VTLLFQERRKEGEKKKKGKNGFPAVRLATADLQHLGFLDNYVL
jgi:hypothetical protein